MKRLLLFLGIILISEAQAQFSKHLVKFKYKGDNPFQLATPINYLSQRAIDRRTRYGIVIDSTDLPVTPGYIDSIRRVPNVTVLNVSKWLNMVSIQTTDPNALTKINSFSFVQTVTPVAPREANHGNNKFTSAITELPPVVAKTFNATADFFNYGNGSFNEIHLHNGEFLHNIGLRGQGMQIALLDGGFFNYKTLDAFDSANANNQILGSWDFVALDTNVNEDIAHGMQCLSTMAANIPGQFIGKAPKASFYLFRTEDGAIEYRIEEFNWACGIERADSSGADIVSTSLGYYIEFTDPSMNHPYADMDGNTTMPALAGDLAAKKGILVFASIGNDGNQPVTKFLSTPSDGDSVVAVGAVSSSGVPGPFSSFGPSFDGQVKPDLASIGVNALIQTTNNTVGMSSGSSFACPNMAGLGACLWQAFPEFNNMKVVNVLRQAGNNASSPNDRIGHGVPDMKLAFVNLLIEFATSNGTAGSCKTILNWTSKDMSAMKYEIERKAPGDVTYIKVGELNGQGNLLANHNYQFADSLINVQAGTISYRIRQIVDTATQTFTAVFIDSLNVNNASSCIITSVSDPAINADKISIAPNPANDQLNLLVETRSAIASMPVHIYDLKGRLMLQFQKSKSTGKAYFVLPIGKLANGKYVLSVFNQTKVIRSIEFIKL